MLRYVTILIVLVLTAAECLAVRPYQPVHAECWSPGAGAVLKARQ